MKDFFPFADDHKFTKEVTDMGFGVLFIGYFITYIMSINSFGVFFRLFGYLVMTYAGVKLASYNKSFRYPVYVSSVLALLSALQSASLIMGYLYDNMVISSNIFDGAFDHVIGYIDDAFMCAFHIILLLAIRAIAKETEVSKIEYESLRNIFLIALYYILRVVAYLPLPIQNAYNATMGVPLFMFFIVCLVLDAVIIFSCYYGICDENDTEMKRKPSRFAFINQYREERDAKQAKAEAEMEKYRQELIERKKNKKKRK